MFCLIVCFGMTPLQAPQIAADSFCKVYEEATKRNELRLTNGEISKLRRSTKEDIATLKLAYKKRCKSNGK